MSISSGDKLLTVEELAEFLQIPRNTLYKWRQQEIGPPAIRLGKHLRYRAEAVRDWLKSREEPHGTHR